MKETFSLIEFIYNHRCMIIPSKITSVNLIFVRGLNRSSEGMEFSNWMFRLINDWHVWITSFKYSIKISLDIRRFWMTRWRNRRWGNCFKNSINRLKFMSDIPFTCKSMIRSAILKKSNGKMSFSFKGVFLTRLLAIDRQD